MAIRIRILILGLVSCALLAAQAEVGPPTKGLTIAVLQGDGVLNPLPRPPEAHVSIRVADAKGEPIRNAVAVFEFPDMGASARFADGSNVKALLTNERGEAMANVKSNEVPGKYQAKVMVNYLGQSALVKLNQENAFPFVASSSRSHRHGFFSKRTVLLIAAAVVSVAVGVVIAKRGGASAPQTPVPPPASGGITITPGTGTVGGH